MFEILNESAAQKEKFRTAANRLLNQCFLLKKKDQLRNYSLMVCILYICKTEYQYVQRIF